MVDCRTAVWCVLLRNRSGLLPAQADRKLRTGDPETEGRKVILPADPKNEGR